MTEKRKKGNGYEEVKWYVLGRLRERIHRDDPFVRITGEEIAESLGISPQMVNTHVRALVHRGVFHRERRCFYSEVMPTDSPSAVSAVPPTIFRHTEGTTAPPVSWPVASVDPAVPSAESFLVPLEEILGIFTDISGKQYYVFRSFREISRSEPGNIRTSFPEVSETCEQCFSETFGNVSETFGNIPETSESFLEVSENISETSQDFKRKYQEKIEENKINKCVDFLGNFVDTAGEEYLKAREQAVTLFERHGAGVGKGTNPKLINRFVAGFILEIPLINFRELEEQLREAAQETAQYENYRGFGKRAGIKRPYIRIASYLKKCFEAADWIWTSLNTPFETRLKKAHKKPEPETVFPQIQVEQTAVKPVPGSQSIMTIPTETQIADSESITSMIRVPESGR